MLILCSNGLSSNILQAELGKALAGCRSAALVVTADNEFKGKNYHVPRCISELEHHNLTVELFDLDEQPADSLLNYDVVEFIGGNPFYLLHSIRKNGATHILQQIASSKILIGWSAAAFVFGPTLELVNCYSPEMNFPGLKDLNGLSLTDVQVLPHYSKLLVRSDSFEEICRAYEETYSVNVIRLNDGDGVFISSKIRIYRP